MKYLLILLLTLSANVFAGQCPDGSNNPNCKWPGETPNWDTRHNVTCEMRNVDGTLNASFTEGGKDYAISGSLFASLAQAYKDWYADLAELAGDSVDTRLIPTPDSPLTQLILIESDLSE